MSDLNLTHPRVVGCTPAMVMLLILTPCVGSADEPDDHAAHGDHHHADTAFIPLDYPEPFGIDPTVGWLDPWPHSHFSRLGTPFVHLFNLEPAFLDRDLFVDVAVINGKDEDETELEFELEWAFTRRIGIVLEAPAIWINPRDGERQRGIGDIAVAPRFLLVDTDRFLLSFNLEAALPTGDEDRDLGRGEVALAPSFSGWLDLGNWITFSFQVGSEHGLESGEDEVFYKGALTYSFLTPGLGSRSTHGHTANHAPPGLTNLIAEFSGSTILDGDQSGRSTGDLLLGVSYSVTDHIEVRVGYQFPLFKPQDFDEAVIASFVLHF